MLCLIPLLQDLAFEGWKATRRAWWKGTCISWFALHNPFLHLCLHTWAPSVFPARCRLLKWRREGGRGAFRPCLLIPQAASPGCAEGYSPLPVTFPSPPLPVLPPQSQFWALCKRYMHVENTLKPSVKLLGSWINANMVSRCLSRGMEYKSDRLLLAPCEAPGRPHLEYGVQLWSLYYGKDIWWIGNRQGGATEKMTQHFGTGGGEREAWRDSGSA